MPTIRSVPLAADNNSKAQVRYSLAITTTGIVGAVSLSLIAVIAGCATAKDTNKLLPGMDATQVRAVLGEPSQTQFIADHIVWKYSLHEAWKGLVPYYLVFSKEPQKLEEWSANEAEYYRQKKLWLEANPPTQRHEIDMTVRRAPPG